MNTTDRRTRSCSHCGQVLAHEQLIPFQDELLCPACLDEQTTVCSCCGERIYKTDNSGTDTIPLCEDCYDNHYERCTHCGALIHRRDTYYRGDDPYCYDCYHTLPAQGINDYYFKPEPIFYGTGKRYFGVELEVDEGGESDSNAERVLDIANSGRELIYCKHDGSLNDGFEIVTHPMTLDFHENNMPWAEIMEEAKKMGYLSHQADTCGLHVHVNRTTFGNTENEQEAAIARVLYFFEKFWEELLKFSRRTQRQLDHWAARYGYKEKPKDILDHAKGHNSAGRYTAVNLTNRDSPLCLVLFPDTGIYVYASTEEILNTALLGFERLLGRSQKMPTDCGEIIKIDRKGRLSRSTFDAAALYCNHWGCYSFPLADHHPQTERESVRVLKSIAATFGYTDEMIDRLLERGFTTDEVEEWLYCGAF